MMKILDKLSGYYSRLESLMVALLSSCLTVMMCLSMPSHASDIDIYQAAKQGDITLMFMIDISGSMTTVDFRGSGSRIDRVKTAMNDLLNGNSSKGVAKLSDDKIIGLSTLGAYYYNENYSRYGASSSQDGAILVPARRLDAVVNGITQRQLLIDTVNSKLVAKTATPTSISYAETVSYLMGTKTSSNGFKYYSTIYSKKNLGTSSETYDSPTSLTQTTDGQLCSGQGIYVLTDGEPNEDASSAPTYMKQALGTKGAAFSCNGSSWDCIFKMSQTLIDKDANPKGLIFKTAVVGFGSDFSGLSSYNPSKTQAENIAALGSLNTDAKRAAYWGIIGDGGWYSGSSSSDVVNSVNTFINNLSSDIPPVTTGAATIPTDALNPTAVQNYTYFSQFEPTPDKTYQLWQGNLKKYNVLNGLITDANGNSVVNSNGKIINNTDLWTQYATTNTLKSYGGVKGVLALGVDSSGVATRKLLTDRDTGGNTTGTLLNQIGVDYLTTTTDSSRGYLLSLLGFVLDPTPANLPKDTSTLISSSELRQIGAIMHSSPVLLTNSGTITTSSSGSVDTTNRNDYILFGTTQGLLHVVDATTGQEKFAFVPNEMVTKQKNAFLKNDSTTAFNPTTHDNLFYGVDGPWSVYSEYVPKADGSLTVGAGLGGATGQQLAYGGLRMGGRSYYALDLQNVSSPTMKFHIDPDNTKVWYNGNSTTYNELSFMGQSWSKPTVGWVRWNGAKRLVMFVGGGYDAGGTNGDGTFNTDGSRSGYAGYEQSDYDQENAPTNTNKKIGAGVYMFDALTGQLLWWTGANATAANTSSNVQYSTAANMKYSVVGQIKTVDRDADGLVDHLYFGDLGGQLWRVDINNNAPSVNAFAKTPAQLLNLHKGQYSPRFYTMPSFSVYQTDNGTYFGVVSIGSGNASSPLFDSTSSADTTTYQSNGYNNDAIYNIYDKDVARSDLFNYTKSTSGSSTTYSYSATLTTPTLTLANSATAPTTAVLVPLSSNNGTTNVAPYTTTGGWYYYFASNKLQDEKVIYTPLVIDSDMYVTTYDGSTNGLSGDCGAGVKGDSFVTQFCMPYGQCTSSKGTSTNFVGRKTHIGVGIVAPSVGSSNSWGSNRKLITATGNLSGSSSYNTVLSLVPQRWYETSK